MRTRLNYSITIRRGTTALRILLVFLALSLTSLAQTTTWTGTASSDWSDASNWSAGVPTNLIDATIPGGTPNDPSTAGVAGAICDTLDLQASATLTIAAGFPLEIDGGGTIDGTIVAGDVFRFVGAGTVNASATLPPIVIDTTTATAVVTFASGTVNGDLTIDAGRLRIAANTTIAVTGDLLAQGGLLDANSVTTAVMNITGGVAFSGTVVTTNFTPILRLDGNWTSDANYAPTGGRAVFVGAVPQTISGSTFNTIEVLAGSNVSTTDDLTLNDDLIVDGTFSTTGDLAVGDDTTVTGNASLLGALDFDDDIDVSGTVDFGSQTPTLGGSFLCSGTCMSTATEFVFDGNGSATVTSSAPLPTVRIDKANTAAVVTMNPTTIDGDLVVQSGRLRVNANSTVTVSGDLLAQGGFMDANSTTNALIDVAGNVVFSGTIADTTFVPIIMVEGDWTSDANFDPTGSRVIFDGSSPQTIQGSMFNTLEIETGADVSAALNLAIRDDLMIRGTFATTGTLDVDDDTNIDATGNADFGSGSHTFEGSITSNGVATSTGAFILDGTQSASVSTTTALPPMTLQKDSLNITVSFNDATVAGDLTVIEGRLRINANVTVVVNGNLLAQGGEMDANSVTTAFLDVNGNVFFTGTVVDTFFSPRILISGNWTADANFAPTGNRVVFDGAALQTIQGENFNALEVPAGSTATTSSDLLLRDDLLVAGTFSTTGSLDVDDDTNIDASGNVDFGGGNHTFGGNFTSAGAITASGSFAFDGNQSATISTTTAFPATTLQKDNLNITVSFNDTTIDADLTVIEGRLRVNANATVVVNGNLLAQGGAMDANSITNAILDVNGSATFSGTLVDTFFSPRILVSGNWTADATFAPTGNRVVFDGAAPQAIQGTSFNTLEVQAGSTVASSGNLFIGDDLIVDGAFSTTGALDIDDDVSVGAGGSLALGAAPHTIEGNFACTGTLTGTGMITFDDDQSSVVTSSATLPAITIQKVNSGTAVTVGETTIGGDATIVEGRLRVQANATVTVDGDMFAQGGILESNSTTNSILDVNGDATFSGTEATNAFVPRLFIAGDFTADGNFAPTLGSHIVELDGANPSTIAASTAGGTIAFQHLIVRNGRREAGQDVDITAQDITIEAGSELCTANRRLAIPASQVIVNGTLSAKASGELALGATTDVDVNAGGTLSIIGVFGNRARVTGEAGGGYALNVNAGATIAGQNYEFQEMGPAGLVIDSGATIAARPFDMRGGRFDLPSAMPNSVLLDVQRPALTEFRFVEFENTNGTGTFNVQTLGGSNVRMVNFSGDFADDPFENDPMGLIDWIPMDNTELAGFQVIGGPQCVYVAFTTLSEPDVGQFRIESAPAPTGPFTVIATFTPAGPSRYEVTDAPLVANQTVHYRLVERLDFGQENVLATGNATPFSAAEPANLYRVGPNGAFADIDAALAAATESQSVIVVEPGTYPSFTIDPTGPTNVRIVGDGSGSVVIDTTSGPVIIRDKLVGEGVELSLLEIGSASSANGGIVIDNNSATILVDRCLVAGGSGELGIEIIDSRFVSLQKTDTTGGIELSMDAACVASKTTADDLTLLDTSRVEAIEFAADNTTVDPTASLTTLAGVMPNVDAADLVGLHEDVTIDFEGPIGGIWFLGISTQLAWFDFNVVVIEVVALMSPGSGAMILRRGILDNAGQGQFMFGVPIVESLIGQSFVLQALMFDPGTGRYRFSNAETVLMMP